MTEREDLIEQIEFLHWRQGTLVLKAYHAETAGDLELAEYYDAQWDYASDEIGRLQSRLYEIEARISRREKIADAAYGRNPS
jgi:hypothetical protein